MLIKKYTENILVTTMERLKFTERELKCLRAIVIMGNAPASAIAIRTQIALPNVSRTIRSLKDKGCLKTERNGYSTVVSLSETKHALLWRKLILEFTHMPLDKILAGAGLEVLASICYLTLRNRKEIAENALVSQRTAAVVLEKFKRFGIVQKTTDYHTSPRFQTLNEFVIEFRHYLNQKIATRFASDASVLWECNHEFIVECKRTLEKDGFMLTATSAFGRFGLSLFVPSSYFFYSPFVTTLRVEDVILHALLVPRRSIMPILLAWKKNERRISLQYIQRQSERYNATALLKDAVVYFETRGASRAEGYPPWPEFLQRAKEYGLA